MRRLVAAAFAALAAIAAPAAAQPVDGTGRDRFIDPAAVEEFVDGAVAAYMRRDGIAGATVAVVRGDQVLLQKGYGIAALDPKRAVDPQTTLFRIASISKTFTYVMAMQLAAEGRLKLDAPADDYLPDTLKFAGDGFPVPTVLDLMQHSAGFEDSALGHLFMAKDAPPIEEYLVTWRPKRVRAPGSSAVYSNYSVGLLGYILARVDGRPFAEMAEQRLFHPLHANDLITFREPPGNDGRGIVPSVGFKRVGGWFAAQPPFAASQLAPAGAAHASAAGIARYMRMLLRGGALDGEVILPAAAHAEMLQPSFRNAPEAAAMAHGFFRRAYGQYQGLEHDGAALFFWSSMVLLPDADFGIFIATNTDTGNNLPNALPRLVIEHFFPEARATDPVAAKDMKLPEGAAGPYVIERRNFTSFEGFLYRLVDSTTIAPMPDGTVVVSSGGQSTRYVVEGDGVLRALESGGRVRIRVQDGQVIGFAGASAVGVGSRLGMLDAPIVLTAAALLLVLGSLATLIFFFARLYYRGGGGQSFGEHAAGWWQALTALLWLGAIGLFAFTTLGFLEPEAAVFGYPGPMLPIARLGLHAAAGATLVLALLLLPAWNGHVWRVRRLTFTLYVLVALIFAALLWRWGALLTPLTIAG